MLIYLDNWTSVNGNPNENYARELMELHTMGVDGGYTQEDVEKGAQVLTGWTIRDNKFYFDSSKHDSSDLKFSFMNNTITDDTEAAGNEFIKALAEHRASSEFICQSLSSFLLMKVLRSRSDALVQSCSSTFLANKTLKIKSQRC